MARARFEEFLPSKLAYSVDKVSNFFGFRTKFPWSYCECYSYSNVVYSNETAKLSPSTSLIMSLSLIVKSFLELDSRGLFLPLSDMIPPLPERLSCI